MKCFVIILLLAAMCALIGLGVFYLGIYDVAATSPHSKAVVWAARVLVDRSVERRARKVNVEGLSDPSLLPMGAEHYREMCEVCHGGPGLAETETAQGLNPKPPRLAEKKTAWSDEELYWIVKHGFKSTGMPAFGPTHSDTELKAITAFVKALHAMSPQEYAAYEQEDRDDAPTEPHD